MEVAVSVVKMEVTTARLWREYGGATVLDSGSMVSATNLGEASKDINLVGFAYDNDEQRGLEKAATWTEQRNDTMPG